MTTRQQRRSAARHAGKPATVAAEPAAPMHQTPQPAAPDPMLAVVMRQRDFFLQELTTADARAVALETALTQRNEEILELRRQLDDLRPKAA